MLKQLVSRIKKVRTILLPVLFVVSLTAAASSATLYHDQRWGAGPLMESPWEPRTWAWRP